MALQISNNNPHINQHLHKIMLQTICPIDTLTPDSNTNTTLQLTDTLDCIRGG